MSEPLKFTRAIVRTPCEKIVEGITSATLGQPDYEKALVQHKEYIKALEYCGLTVTVLPPDNRYPDSTFVEDTALMTPHCAILTNPGADSRKGEVDIIRDAVSQFYDDVESITAPGTVEAGDIMMVGSTFYIGLSDRTNDMGTRQMIDILRRYGMNGITVQMDEMLHLKTGLSYLENNKLMITGEFLQNDQFDSFDQLPVDSDEAYAANSLWINDTVLVPAGFPKTQEKIESAGYNVFLVDTSEFRKIDGGLSCLSLRF